MRAEITTVGELVAALAGYPPQTRVRLAVAPGYPQAATIGVIACSPDDADAPTVAPTRPRRGTGGVDRRRHPDRLPARDRPQRPRPQLDLNTTRGAINREVVLRPDLRT